MKRIVISGGVLVFLGALFWSLNAPIVKFLSVDPFLLCGLRAITAGIAMAVFIRPKQLVWNRWMLLYCFAYCALCLCIMISLTMTSAPIAIGMQYTAVVWLFLAELLRTRRFTMKRFVPVLVIMIGVVFFMCSGTDDSSMIGNLVALLEGIFFACMTASSPKASGTNPLGLTAVGNLFTGILTLTMFPARTMEIVYLNGLDWILILVLGVVQIGCGYAFYNLGVQKVNPQKASVIALWEMILGPVWVAIFLNEYPSTIVIIGFVIIIAGMLMDSRISDKK